MNTAYDAAIQILLTLFFGVLYYILGTVYDGLLSLIFQPIMAVICTVISGAIIWVLGSPLRFIRPWHVWWRAHWWWVFPLGAAGFLMMMGSLIVPPSGIDDDGNAIPATLGASLALGGWFLTLFTTLHFYLPEFRQQSRVAS